MPLLAENFIKTPKHGGFFEKCLVLAKETIFRVCTGNEAFLVLLAEKFVETPKHGGFFEMCPFLVKSTIFRV